MIIGISGYARTGKNTLANILIKQLKQEGISALQFALADALKLDIHEFCQHKYGINSFTEITEEKNLIRDFLVFHGKMMRIKTNGRYWINILNKKIKTNKLDKDWVIVTDIRYDIYPKDERHWIQEEMRGKLIWLEKYTKDTNPYVELIKQTPPANKDELENGIKLKEKSNYVIEWEHQSDTKLAEDLINNSYLNAKVEHLLNSLLYENTKR